MYESDVLVGRSAVYRSRKRGTKTKRSLLLRYRTQCNLPPLIHCNYTVVSIQAQHCVLPHCASNRDCPPFLPSTTQLGFLHWRALNDKLNLEPTQKFLINTAIWEPDGLIKNSPISTTSHPHQNGSTTTTAKPSPQLPTRTHSHRTRCARRVWAIGRKHEEGTISTTPPQNQSLHFIITSY